MKYSMVVTVNWDDGSKETSFEHDTEQAVRTTIKRFMRNVPDATSFTFIVVCHTQGDKDV